MVLRRLQIQRRQHFPRSSHTMFRRKQTHFQNLVNICTLIFNSSYKLQIQQNHLWISCSVFFLKQKANMLPFRLETIIIGNIVQVTLPQKGSARCQLWIKTTDSERDTQSLVLYLKLHPYDPTYDSLRNTVILESSTGAARAAPILNRIGN